MPTVKYSVSAYIADGTTTDYLITWDYLDDDHITVEIDGLSNADPAASHTFTKLNDTTVRVTDGIGGAIAAGKEIQIRRNTPITTRPISFSDGSALLAADLNKNSDYLLYSMQEALDQVDFTVQYQEEAEGFRDATQALRDESQAFRNLSESDAAEADLHRIAAALSETNAAASETAAAASEAAAFVSQGNLQDAQDNAQASATAALASENAAAASEVASAASEAAAAVSEANAAGSEAGVAADAATATSKAAAASVSEANALIYKNNAAASASNSEISAVNSSNSATASANSAIQASNSENAAATSRNTASTYATNSQASAVASEASKVAAAASETAAATSEANAATSETNAATSEANALTSREAAEAALDNFDDRYLGAKATDPTTDNDGDALITGALYFNTTDDVMKVYEGSAWAAAYASLSGSLLAANNLSDVASPSAARTNIGLTGNSVLPNDAGYITISEVPANNSINEGDTSVTIVDNGSDGKVVVRVDGADVAEFNDTHMVIPKGTTAERDPAAVVGSLRYNTTTGFFETFTSSGWGAIATPPSIIGISPNNFSGESGATFTVDGAFFDVETTAVFKGADGTEYAAATVTFVNSTQITLTNATNLPVANEPFKIKVTNGAGLSVESIQGIDAGSVPAFTTAAGNLATTTRWDEAVSVTVNATDAESTISGYSVTEGNLPAGLSLNATTGAITGTSTAQSTTTYTFTIGATDSAGNTNTRQFSIQIVNAAPVWNSPADGFTLTKEAGAAINLSLSATDPEGEAVSYSLQTPVSGYSVSGSTLSGTVSSAETIPLLASDGFASSLRNISIILDNPLYSFSNYTFTSCECRGSIGPSLALGQAFALAAFNSDTSLYNVIGEGIQVWTVPATGAYEFDAYGAYGGPGESSGDPIDRYGGQPRRIRASFSLNKGELIGMVVGQRGGETNTSFTSSIAGGGGGGSFVFKIGSSNYFNSSLTPLVVAAGGQGANWANWNVETLEARGVVGVSSNHIPSVGSSGGRGAFGGSFNYTPYRFTDAGWEAYRHSDYTGSRNWRYGAPVKNASGYLHADALVGGGSFEQTADTKRSRTDNRWDGNGSQGGSAGGFGGGGGSKYEGGGGGGYWGGVSMAQNDYNAGIDYSNFAATSYADTVNGSLLTDELVNTASDNERLTYYVNNLPPASLMGKIVVTRTS